MLCHNKRRKCLFTFYRDTSEVEELRSFCKLEKNVNSKSLLNDKWETMRIVLVIQNSVIPECYKSDSWKA